MRYKKIIKLERAGRWGGKRGVLYCAPPVACSQAKLTQSNFVFGFPTETAQQCLH